MSIIHRSVDLSALCRHHYSSRITTQSDSIVKIRRHPISRRSLSVCLSADRYIDGSLDRAVHAKASFTAYELTLTSRPSYTKRQLVT